MAAGKPILSTNIGAIPEIVKNEKNGILAEPDPKEIAKGIERLILNPEVGDTFRKQNIKDADLYSWKTIAEKYIKLYEKISQLN